MEIAVTLPFCYIKIILSRKSKDSSTTHNDSAVETKYLFTLA